jgi:hypothetical protein
MGHVCTHGGAIAPMALQRGGESRAPAQAYTLTAYDFVLHLDSDCLLLQVLSWRTAKPDPGPCRKAQPWPLPPHPTCSAFVPSLKYHSHTHAHRHTHTRTHTRTHSLTHSDHL